MVDWRKLITELSVVGITIKNMKERKKLNLVIEITTDNIMGIWAHGMRTKMEGILENKKLTKEEILKELKQVYKLFK